MPPSAIPLTHAYRLLNHGPTVLVSSAHGGRRNVMAAAWNMPLDFDPPKVAVVIDKSTYTRELIEASGEFVLAVPSRAITAQVLAVGSRSGRDGDKFEAMGLDAMPAARVAAPLPAGCVGWLECRLIPERHTEDAYDTCFAEVVAAAADQRIFANGRWDYRDDNTELQSIHHLGAGLFVRPGGALKAATR